MAQFEPFNLGQVFATAEGIKQARAQATTDRLREQYLGEQIGAMKEERARNTRMDEVTLGKEKAMLVYRTMQQASQSQNPKNFLESQVPDLVQNLQSNGVDWATVDDSAAQQMIKGIMDKASIEAGIDPIQSQQINGATVLTQGGKYMNAFQPRAGADNTPNSYDEFARAKGDPAYAQFLRERRGQGLSVTLPDGTTISDGGAQPFALPKPTQNKLGDEYTDALAGMQRLQGIVASVKPEYLTYAGQLKGKWNSVKAKAPEVFGKLSPQEQEYTRGYQTWRSDTLNNLNLYIKEITGAAMAIPEAARIKATIPNEDDDHPTFMAKMDTTMKRLSLVAARSSYLLSNPAQSLGDISLDRMQMIITDRANALYTGYLQQGLNEREARQRALTEASQQFGLSNAAAN